MSKSEQYLYILNVIIDAWKFEPPLMLPFIKYYLYFPLLQIRTWEKGESVWQWVTVSVSGKGCKEGQLLCLNSFDSPSDIPFIHLSCTALLIRHVPLQTWLLVMRSCRACCCLSVSNLRCKILFTVTRRLQVMPLKSLLTHDMREGRGKDCNEHQLIDDGGDAAACDGGGNWAWDAMLMLWYKVSPASVDMPSLSSHVTNSVMTISSSLLVNTRAFWERPFDNSHETITSH